MRRLALVLGLVTVAVMLMGASVASADTISATCTWAGQPQPCDSTAWYPSALTVVWNATPPPNGVSGCTPEVANQFDSDQITPVSCSATWPGSAPGTTVTITQAYTLHVETSSPNATVAPNRAPDANGWYSHPVAGALSAASFSGIASCTSTTYAGPSTTGATVSGTCTDNAGKTVAVTSAPFAFDATPPTLTAAANPGDQSVALSWQTGSDLAPIASIQVTRSGGAKTAGVDTVYTGSGTGFTDSHLNNGLRYTYTITARDLAGNVAVQTITTTPAARLLGPALNAHLTAPPMLSWTAAPSATYYNVQLFRGSGAKVLSLWPAQASIQLRRTWRFEGHRYRLKPGKYRWYVWPGLGRRKTDHYGHMIGSSTFVVVR
jgi:hypothetical protein